MFFGIFFFSFDSKSIRRKFRLGKGKVIKDEGLNNVIYNLLKLLDLWFEDKGNLEWIVEERDEY